jgi:hypothetical protein
MQLSYLWKNQNISTAIFAYDQRMAVAPNEELESQVLVTYRQQELDGHKVKSFPVKLLACYYRRFIRTLSRSSPLFCRTMGPYLSVFEPSISAHEGEILGVVTHVNSSDT